VRQALHIFKKDAGHLRYHIGLTLLAAAAFCLTGAFNIKGAGPTAFILPIVWWFLIAAVIHAEPLPGKGHFWLTRPYQRKSLFCAKALFIVAFVNVPLLIADIVIVHAAGFEITAKVGGLLWTQVLLLLVFEVPAVAVSSITSGLLELLIATLFLILVALAWILVVPLTHFGFNWTAVEWIRNYYLLGQVAIGAAIILLCQYAYRATFATRTAAVFMPILLLAGMALLPWTAAFELQMYLSKRNVDPSSVRIQLDAERKWAGRVYLGDRGDVVADIPIQVEGLPTGTELKPDGVIMRLLASNGETLSVTASPPDSFGYDSGVVSLRVRMAKTSYEKFRRQPLQVRGTLYFSVYERKPSASIPLNSHPMYVDGVGLCAAGSRFLLCNAAFRPPSSSVSIQVTQESPKGPVRSTERLSRVLSSSPFPADFNVDPIFQLFSSRLGPISDALIQSSEPIAYVKKSFRIDHLVLADFTFRK
jgi:hypothetical protein